MPLTIFTSSSSASVAAGSGSAVQPRAASLYPAPDGIRRSFIVGEDFLEASIEIHHNGRKLMLATDSTPKTGDYYVSESEGVDSGFDTIVLVSFTPTSLSELNATYFIL